MQALTETRKPVVADEGSCQSRRCDILAHVRKCLGKVELAVRRKFGLDSRRSEIFSCQVWLPGLQPYHSTVKQEHRPIITSDVAVARSRGLSVSVAISIAVFAAASGSWRAISALAFIKDADTAYLLFGWFVTIRSVIAITESYRTRAAELLPSRSNRTASP
jgi:hypothetical protein